MTWDYDALGRVATISTSDTVPESFAFTYAGDLPVSVTQEGVLDHATSITYNDLFEPTTVTYAGDTVDYVYDNDGLLLSAGDMAITRSALSGRVEAVGVGTVSTALGYSGFGEVNLATTTIGTSEVELALTHHATNRRITVKAETTDDVTTSRQYEYDGLGRLTAVRDGSTLLERYTYDANNRRVQGNGKNYVYDDDDRLVAAGGGAEDVYYEYSEDGYRTARQEGGARTEFSYTSTGQLTAVSKYVYEDDEGEGIWTEDHNVPVITYHLDVIGRRVAKQVDENIVEKYLWGGHNTTLLAVYDGSDNLIARFEYGVGRMPMRMTQGEDTYYFAYDQVGSLRAVFDDAGTLIHEITYDSYGNIESETTTQGFASVYIPPFGFAGGLHNRDTGLVLFGFRDYDPETGTWLTPDPIGFAGGDTYLYGYCGGDPVNCIDPEGLLTWYDAALNWSANACAGYGDVLTFDLLRLARYCTGNEMVNTDSNEYSGGQWIGMGHSLVLGGGRLAYAAINKISTVRYLGLAAKQTTFAKSIAVAKTASNSRTAVKNLLNWPLKGKLKYSWNDILHNYLLDPADIIRASGRTNWKWNSLGAYLFSAFAKEGYEKSLGIDSIPVEMYEAYDHIKNMKIMQ